MIISKAILFLFLLLVGRSQKEMNHQTDTTFSQKTITKQYSDDSARGLLAHDTSCRTRLNHIPTDYALTNRNYLFYLEGFVEIMRYSHSCSFNLDSLLDSLEWNVKEDGKSSLLSGLAFNERIKAIYGSPTTSGEFKITITIHNSYCNDTAYNDFYLRVLEEQREDVYASGDQQDNLYTLTIIAASLFFATTTCCIAQIYFWAKRGNDCCKAAYQTILQVSNNDADTESSAMVGNRSDNGKSINTTTVEDSTLLNSSNADYPLQNTKEEV